ncbi:MAG TPA: nucleoside triphosphate pyrophosphohydrolase, partial [Rhodospirillaceae bacterium]|nr:nucleoside triphosphate pyrophosphohydrolase [Rhodospirillaceae bacterium]
LFQVVFYAQLGKDEGLFDFETIAAAVADKMERRHPHVFGQVHVPNAEAQTVQWEEQKAAERAKTKGSGTLEGISIALPALTRALKLQNRAGRVGFDWPEPIQVLDKIAEEIEEVRLEIAQGVDPEHLADEVGDLLFASVNLARKLKLDPESCLRRGNRKFERRFRHIEQTLADRGRSPSESSLEEMEALWVAAKHLE